ncbi:E3 ubiquitin-protein ligase PUB23-like [Punica granatum]|uniref:U-box domain-containing protein n=2 Tax=Punica granatum TaxID=22663 RepID=A0A218VV91_PUNGR|nr:E3 ubiquitin-protein ligase PUB23-like [Punica granatum]OWM64316.1 hypothetical protein CDL15_Pgr014106 [Punica granatum]PKI57904.1 hypothetical protein CRG98_021692 [Punica granatum]
MESPTCPPDFRCPISMELMRDPVTISTGVTYERENIEKWFFTYKRTTCPTTMQQVVSLDATPNHTLKRLILAWLSSSSHHPPASAPQLPSPERHQEMLSLLKTIESSPFKVTALKKLKAMIGTDDETKSFFIGSKGVEIVVQILTQILSDGSDFSSFRAGEEALGVIHLLSLSSSDQQYKDIFDIISKAEPVKSLVAMLQRGSAEARLHSVIIIHKMLKRHKYHKIPLQDHPWTDLDLFKSMLELASDEILTKASSRALDALIEILSFSKGSRVRAIEVGAVCILIELLPESNRARSEKILVLLKLLSEGANGRSALVEHGLGIAVVSKKLLHVSAAATKLGVKILWQVCISHPTEQALEEMLAYGVVKKLAALLHMDGWSSTKDRVVRMFKLHGNTWKRYPCFPRELKDYLGVS